MTLSTINKLADILDKPCFSANEARQLGVHPSLLSYYCNNGVLERISRGVYRKANREIDIPIQWEDVALTALSVPAGVICLITALSFYNLTNEIPRQIWIAVPRESWPPTRPNARIVRMSNISLGVEVVRLGEATLQIFDQERTVIDSFRLLSREIAIKALKRYLTTTEIHKPDLIKLRDYSKELRTNISTYVEALTV